MSGYSDMQKKQRFTICAAIRFVSAQLLLLLLIVVSGCGIPSFVYIAPANRGNVDETEVSFFHNTNNNIDQFTGYDIYYKFYENSSAGNSSCRNEKNFIDDSDTVVLGTSRLTSRQFRRIIKDDNENAIPVVIPPDKGSAHRFIISIADDTDIRDNSEITNSPDTAMLYRNVAESDPDSDYKSLNGHSSFFNPDDADINGIVNNINDLLVGEDLNIAFYAVGFGYGDNFQVIYGEAIFIGYISLFGLNVHSNC